MDQGSRTLVEGNDGRGVRDRKVLSKPANYAAIVKRWHGGSAVRRTLNGDPSQIEIPLESAEAIFHSEVLV